MKEKPLETHESKDGLIVHVVRWILDSTRAPTLLTALGGALSATAGEFIAGSKPAPYVPILFGTGLAVMIAGTIWNLIVSPGIESLTRDRDRARSKLEMMEADYYEHFQYHLQLFAEQADLKGTERVSVYRHTEDGFQLLGRYSSNPEQNHLARRFYPLPEGCIAKAWTSGEAVIGDLPDPATNPEEYIQEQLSKCNMPEATVRALRMKSRAYYAFRIDGHGLNKPGAVLVIESTKARKGFDKVEVKELIRKQEGRRLAEFLHRMRGLEPSLDVAKVEGF